MNNFPTDIDSIFSRINSINPYTYAKTRNYIDGSVTKLSPYISRGVISTVDVVKNLTYRGVKISDSIKLIQELAWREYWQLCWNNLGDQINTDLRFNQTSLSSDIPLAVSKAQTGIVAIDNAIEELYQTGYMHNHIRMYLASITCNIAKTAWLKPAKWFYYHLIDGDWASNALSWQWIAGTNSNKKYYANQENINRFCNAKQVSTWLDTSYEEIEDLTPPVHLLETIDLNFTTTLPKTENFALDSTKPTLIYNYYNLDPRWHNTVTANRVLLIEPSIFKSYPIGEKPMNFMLELSKNIEGIVTFIGEFSDFIEKYQPQEIFYKAHPLNKHYIGKSESQARLFNVKGEFKSFFRFWKQCEKEMKKW